MSLSFRHLPNYFFNQEVELISYRYSSCCCCCCHSSCCATSSQESLANAKGSARQPWYIVRKSPNRPPFSIAQQHQRNLYIVEKYFQCATIPSLTLWVYLHSFSRCSRSNMPTSAKFRENLNVQQFKVIQGR